MDVPFATIYAGLNGALSSLDGQSGKVLWKRDLGQRPACVQVRQIRRVRLRHGPLVEPAAISRSQGISSGRKRSGLAREGTPACDGPRTRLTNVHAEEWVMIFRHLLHNDPSVAASYLFG